MLSAARRLPQQQAALRRSRAAARLRREQRTWHGRRVAQHLVRRRRVQAKGAQV
jgi:hypothetical protein